MFAASRAVTVMTFDPLRSVTPEIDQLAVPVAVPLPPRSFVQVTCVTPTLSDAVPPRFMEAEAVLYVDPEVGDEIVIAGFVLSGGV